jgi:hypothetical protein
MSRWSTGRHLPGGVIDEGERGDAARAYSQPREPLVGAAKRKPRRAETGGELLQMDAAQIEPDQAGTPFSCPSGLFPVLPAPSLPFRKRLLQ